ncbi:MAG: capsule assembly Wzi family protein [Gammaproteobacteria bacterium]
MTSTFARLSVTQQVLVWHPAYLLCLVLFAALACPTVHAAITQDTIWVSANNLQARNDIEILADTGVLHGPIDAWPLPWAAVTAELYRVDPAKLTQLQLSAWRRLMAEMPHAPACFDTQAAASVTVQRGQPQLRWFAPAPRGKNDIEGALSAQCENFFYALDVSHDNRPFDNGANQNRLDGSYVGVGAGNWLLLAGEEDRWWGSGWGGGMLLDTNARPVPALEVTRASAVPFQTPWLSWIGPWSLTTFIGELNDGRYVPHTRIWGLRIAAQPTEHFQIGLYRTALWGGEGQANSASQFWRVVTGGNALDNPQDPGSVAGSQLAGVDVRWHWLWSGQPWAFYVNGGFRDETHHIPKKFFPLFGLETAWSGEAGVSKRLFIEYSDTTAGWPFTNGIPINTVYENSQYQSGYRYYGQTIGYPTDNDSRVLTVGLIRVNGENQSLSLLMRAGVLNWDGTNAPPPGGNPLAPERIPLASADVQWAMPIGSGILTADVGAAMQHPQGQSKQYPLQAWLSYQVAVP